MSKNPKRKSSGSDSARQISSNEFYEMCDDFEERLSDFAAEEVEEIEDDLEEYAHFYMERKVRPIGATPIVDINEQLDRLKREIGEEIGGQRAEVLLSRLERLVDGYVADVLGRGPS